MLNLKIIGCLLFLFAGELTAQNRDRLVSPEWLEKRMKEGNLVIFHIGRAPDYQEAHIPGAVFISSQEYTIDDDVRVFDLPEKAALQSLFEKKGLTNDHMVVIYTAENWIPLVTRLYFTLDYLGHGAKTFILDGGMKEWQSKGGPLTSEVPEVTPGNFQITPDDNLLADRAYVRSALENDAIDIVDCRSAVYYTGIEPTRGARNGRMPGAKTIPYTSLYEASDSGAYKFIDTDRMRKIFLAQGLSPDRELVLYCHIGMQLTVVYTTAQILGYQNIKIYDGSFHEWGPDESLPVELD